MFTGLIAELGEVVQAQRTADGMVLRIRAALAGELHSGDSVAVNGVCLTATECAEHEFSAEVVNETLRLTSLGELPAATQVNLELPLRAGDRFGGHIVQGHVDGVGTITEIVADGFSRRLSIAVDPQLLRYIVQKGSIAVDGVSLTVAARGADGFTVALIPETLADTNLGQAQLRQTVNLEVDVVAKYVEGLIAR